MSSVPEPRVLLVVATLGRRPEYLAETLTSIRSQGIPADIVIVAPKGDTRIVETARDFGAQLLPDPGSLTKAINRGVESRLPRHMYVNWLNDDDLLTPGSLALTTQLLDSHPEATVAYGACQYIDSEGRDLWVSRAGPWAERILSFGPDLIPQPGMLIRASAWAAVGGLNETYDLAFDLDLLLRLRRLGPLVATSKVVSAFRWHADSLTVEDRAKNIAESERAKRDSLSPMARKLAWIWEPPIRFLTYKAANEVQRRARRLAR
jgi:GT2 family glycosyltransferase